jgi:hypothetical protein
VRSLAIAIAWTFAALSVAGPSKAADIGLGDERKVEVHGFVSPGFIVTTGNNYLAHTKRGSFEFNEVGLNFTVPLTDKLRTGIQLFSRDHGPIGNYTPRADWFYLDYKLDDWFGIRAGPVKIPVGLYNDTVDIDAGRVQVLLPQSIYNLTNRDFALAQTGGEIYGRIRLGRSGGAFEYRIYAGTIYIDVQSQTTANGAFTDVDVPYVTGQRLMYETPIEGLRLGGSLEAAKIDLAYNIPVNPQGLPPGPGSLGLPYVVAIGSVEYAPGRLQLAAEWARSRTHLETSRPLPGADPRKVTTNEAAYVMGSYRLTDWFAPGLYYSLYYRDIDNRSGRDKSAHDVAATLRFDINSWWLVKLEGHFISGTALLNPAINDNRPLTSLEQNMGAFFMKTTAHF